MSSTASTLSGEQNKEQQRAAKLIDSGMRLQRNLTGFSEAIENLKGLTITPYRLEKLRRQFNRLQYVVADNLRIIANDGQ